MPKFGVLVPLADGLTNGRFLGTFGAVLEECGVESVYAVEHVVVGEDFTRLYAQAIGRQLPSGRKPTPAPDPLELLAYLAAVTETVKLGTAVVVAPLHSPAVLAKRAATVDRLSDGRMLLGLGNHMFSAAKSDLEADVVDRRGEQGCKFGRRRRGQIDRKPRQQSLEQLRLMPPQRMTLAAPEKGAACS